MKKAVSLISCLVLFLLMVVPTIATVSAERYSVTLTPSTETVEVGGQVTYTVTLGDDSIATSGAIEVFYDSAYFKLVSGEFSRKADATIAAFPGNKRFPNRGVISFDAATEGQIDFAGEYFVFVLEAVAEAEAPQTVYVEVKLNDSIADTKGGIATGTTTTTIGAKECEHDWDEGVVTTEPTCTEAGQKTFTCSKCNETKTEPVAALGHDLTKTEAKEATCEEAGNSAYYTCARCEKYFSDEKGENEIEKDSWIISAKKHQYTETVTKEPTCTKAGEKTFTCSACGDSYTESVDPLGHAAEKETVVKEATCTEDGEKAYVCSRCNEVLRTEVISAKGHEFDADWTVDQPATADAIGVKSRHCRNCDATTDVEYLPMLPHELKVESDGKTYCYVDGEKFMGGRLRLDGKWYHFSDVDGHMMLGFETLANGKIRYYEENNYWWRFGVAEIDGEHYFFDGDGYLITGEGEPDANGFTWYVYHINGTDVYYALDPANNYAWVYGLKEIDGATYYYPQYATFKGPAKGVVSVNGVWMNFDETTGEKLVGWVKTAEGTRYYEDGYYWYKTGFIQILEEGETTENGKYYFFDYDTGYLFAPDESEWEYGMAWYVYTINGTNIYYAMDPENGFCWVTGKHTVKDGTTYNFVKWATEKQPEVVNPTEPSGN